MAFHPIRPLWMLGILMMAIWQPPMPGPAENLPPYVLEECVAKAQEAENRFLYAEALEWYQKALTLKGRDPDLQAALARQLIGMEKLDEAHAVLLDLVAQFPQHAEGHTLLAIYLQNFKDDFAAAEQHYRLAIQADPRSTRARGRLGDLYINLHRYDEARAVFEELLRINPRSITGLQGLGKTAMKESQLEKALQCFRDAAAADPTNPDSYRLLAQGLSQAGKRQEAQAALQKYQKLKSDRNKIVDLQRATRRAPNKSENWLALGKEYLRQNYSPNALQALRRSAELDPANAQAHSLLAVLYLNQKDILRAQDHLLKAISLDPQNPDLYNNLGVCYLMQNKYPEAVEAFQTAVQYGSQDPGVERNLKLAIQKLKQAKPLRP
ncbi:MAG TPA: tetratricopeptide repeat protein [bacterium]|nr:tetratricopeptide repeat protein [bacterium]